MTKNWKNILDINEFNYYCMPGCSVDENKIKEIII